MITETLCILHSDGYWLKNAQDRIYHFKKASILQCMQKILCPKTQIVCNITRHVLKISRASVCKELRTILKNLLNIDLSE